MSGKNEEIYAAFETEGGTEYRIYPAKSCGSEIFTLT